MEVAFQMRRNTIATAMCATLLGITINHEALSGCEQQIKTFPYRCIVIP